MTIENMKSGILGGLLGGVVFGMMMGMMGMLPMIGSMVGAPNALAGFGVHMMMSAGIGAGFAIVLGGAVRSARGGVALGVGYGMLWWVLGPLTMMPVMMGKGFGVNWNLDAASAMLPSLMGHMIFGLILGASYAVMSSRAAARSGEATA